MTRWFSILVLVALAGSANFVSAQDADPALAPQMGSEAAPAPAAIPEPMSVVPDIPQIGGADGVYRILVIGDSLAGGLGSGLTRMSAPEEIFEVVGRANESSGLARTEVYDWPAAVPKIIEGKSFDAAVVMLGINDRQAIRNGSFRYKFRTPEWVAAYQARVEALVAALRTEDIRIFWVGLPPIANDSTDADMVFLSDLQKAKLDGKDTQFVDIRPYFANADGSLIETGPDEAGTERKFRSKDGIGFQRHGNNKLGQIVLATIKAAEGSPVAVVLPPVAKAGSDIPASPQSPLFGQAGPDDATLTYEANVIAVTTGREPTAISSATSRLGLRVSRNSLADKFYRQGEAIGAPLGRFDDFSFTPPAAPQ